MKRTVELVVEDDRLHLCHQSLEACLACLEAFPGRAIPPGSLEVAFVDEPHSGQLHKDFFDDPEPTDVMTFPGDPEDGHAGDIAICPAVAASACGKSGLPFAEELTLYLVHSWLHLAGLRDSDDEEIREMRLAEDILMNLLRENGAILEATWESAENS